MTNPISKAIVKAAVAMGYGKKSDYKGSSVAEVLEKFAAIAKDKGGSSGGGGVFYVTMTNAPENPTIDKTFSQISEAYESGQIIKLKNGSVPETIFDMIIIIKGGSGGCMFLNLMPSDSYMSISTVQILANNTIEISTHNVSYTS